MHKGPLLALDLAPIDTGFRLEHERRPDPAPDVVALGRRAHAIVQRALRRRAALYARVDVLRDAAGEPAVLELELIEPSLFLDFVPGTAETLARAILARLPARADTVAPWRACSSAAPATSAGGRPLLLRSGHEVVIHDVALPPRRAAGWRSPTRSSTAPRARRRPRAARGARRAARRAHGDEVLVSIAPELGDVLAAVLPDVLVDARMRKRAQPETQRGLAPLTIGLGPNFVAGQTTDLAVETQWGDASAPW